MLVPIKWLKEFVDVDISPAELADKLVSCGFEIEEIIDLSQKIKNVVVGKILALEKHPNADKLQVCSIDVGTDLPLQIVTGAHNIAVGDCVPVAKDGAVLPDGKIINTGELRGIISYGMLCGGSEIGLTEADYKGAEAHGILILEAGIKLGTDINEVIGTDDIVLDVAITANRTDANSIFGIAREVAAVTGKPLRQLNTKYVVSEESVHNYIAIENRATNLCPRYIGGVVKDIVLTESTKIIKERLRAVGIRPINNIVDITNYVLIEVGQPMHAFDISTIKDKKIIIRTASDNEQILALDKKSYILTANNLVIANTSEAMAIAGVMGGANYSVLPHTQTIVFESARFARDNIRSTARVLNLHSEASARYEKGVDFHSQDIGMARALALISANNWGTIVGGLIDNFPVKPPIKEVKYTAKDIETILGIAIPAEKIASILNSLTLYTTLRKEELTTVIPTYREDMIGINDIAEEVIRIYGYNNIVSTLIKDGTMVIGGKNLEQLTMDKIKNILVGKGACEIITYSFITPKAFDYLQLPKDSKLRNAIKLANPMGEDYSIMRTTLAHSMLKTIATNYIRGNKKVQLFEIAKTYIPKELPLTNILPYEDNMLCIGAYGEDFYSFKAIIEDLMSVLRLDIRCERETVEYMHPTRTAKVIDNLTGHTIGYFGEVYDIVSDAYGIDKRVYLAELEADYMIKNAKTKAPFQVISKYQSVERDLALLAETATEAAKVIDTIGAVGGKILTNITIFDVYTGNQVPSGYKSMAVKLTFQSYEKTLTDAEVNAEIDIILSALTKIKVKLRD